MKNNRIPTAVLTISEVLPNRGEKLTSLKCRMTGEFEPFSQGIIYPGGKTLQVKNIDKNSDGTFTVKVKGISQKQCIPFAVITAEKLKVRIEKRGYFIPSDFRGKKLFTGKYNVTGGIFKGYRLFNSKRDSAFLSPDGALYKVDFPKKVPLVPGGEYDMVNEKGFKQTMVLVYPGFLDKKNASILSSRIEKFRSHPSVKAIYSMILRTDGYVELPFFLKEESFEGAVVLGDAVVMEREYASVKSRILKMSKGSGGFSENDLFKKLKISRRYFDALAEDLIQKGALARVDGYLAYRGEGVQECLSPLAKEAFKYIVDAGSEGISSRTFKNPGLCRCMDEVKRMGLARVLDDDLFISEEGWEEVLKKLFEGSRPGETLDISLARDRTGLSRRYIISLFNILEVEGRLKRDEDERVILP